MAAVDKLLSELEKGALDTELGKIYGNKTEELRRRAIRITEAWRRTFPDNNDKPAGLFSAPGRTEIGGNHTDHEHGCVLAGAVDTDIIACAAENNTDTIRFLSEGWPMLEISLHSLEPVEGEKETTSALIRGIAAKLTDMGYKVKGFDAYASSDVLPGSGLSSSAAFEVLAGVIMNHMFCGDKLTDVQLAQIGQYAENVYFGKPSGLMDQMASSVGGAVAIDFNDPENPVIERAKVDLEGYGYALCIVDSGAGHEELTGEYAAIPGEMKKAASVFGKEVLRDVDENEFWDNIPKVREAAGDRAVLRAVHFFGENKRAQNEAEALSEGDFDKFLEIVRESGRSSWMYLQNICPAGSKEHQEMGVALAVAERALNGKGAVRVHGGGFAGTIQAFVPLDEVEAFRRQVEAALGTGRCHILSIRKKGGSVIAG